MAQQSKTIIKKIEWVTDGFFTDCKAELAVYTEYISGNLFDPENIDISLSYGLNGNDRKKCSAFFAGNGKWLIRFSVFTEGDYSAELSVRKGGKLTKVKSLNFTVIKKTGSRGILSVEPLNRRHFIFENGDIYTAIGHNIAWGNKKNPVGFYENICRKFNKCGANWTRLWLTTEWFLTLFPKNSMPSAFEDSFPAAETLDKIMEIFEKYGIYVQLVLFNHGNVKGKSGPLTDRNWHDFAFNADTPGGYLNSPSEFFTDKRARRDTKNYLRYVVSRWGYSPNILCYELFNEASSSEADIRSISEWHRKMTAYLRETDARGHMISTSSASVVCPLIYEDYFDFINHHRYGSVSNIYQIISDVTWCAACYDKPVILAECGAAWTADSAVDRTVIHQHVWAGLMSGSAGTGCQWYWERIDALENEEGYLDYAYASVFADRIPWGCAGHRFVTGDEVLLDSKKANALGYVNGNYAYLWLYDPAYTFTYRTDRVTKSASLTLRLKNGIYNVMWYDTENGRFLKPSHYTVNDGVLTLTVPEFRHDIALCVESVEK